MVDKTVVTAVGMSEREYGREAGDNNKKRRPSESVASLEAGRISRRGGQRERALTMFLKRACQTYMMYVNIRKRIR
jgi:hypothetical protein